MENSKDEEKAKLNKELIRQQRVDVLSLNRLKILSEDGKEILFSSLWKDNIVIIIFLRHFNCISCRAHADQIWNLQKDMNKINSRIVFIGNGNANIIKIFKEELKLDKAEIYTDPSLKTFKACGMHRNFSHYINLKSISELRNLKKKGYEHGNYAEGAGDRIQNGGVVGFKDPGKVIYHFTSKYLGDVDDSNDWPSE